ncbi:MAG: hypothetical protein IKF14_05205 [Atopobiaceae bacterium]|nr:hypothetical protein [Atopobiaceae bacterium]MBR3158487.1 hypothetical protein [Atopobiaceae bacterium]
MSGAYGVWGRHAELHTSPEISWSLCDGCASLNVKDLTKTMVYKLHGGTMYEYKCESMAEKLTRKQIYEMDTRTCPLGRDPMWNRRTK